MRKLASAKLICEKALDRIWHLLYAMLSQMPDRRKLKLRYYIWKGGGNHDDMETVLFIWKQNEYRDMFCVLS